MQDETISAPPPRTILAEYWLQDQAIAFAATLLGTHDPFSEPRPFACARYLSECLARVPFDLLSDSTLRLLATIDETYHDWYTGERLQAILSALRLDSFFADPIELGLFAKKARSELADRDKLKANDLNRVLISHIVYLLNRPHLSILKVLKWLNRASPNAVPGIKLILEDLEHPESTRAVEVEKALNGSRNTDAQTRDRLDDIDDLHALLLDAAGDQRRKAEIWLSRIVIAYRSSMFCWPLLTEGTEEETDANQHDATEGQTQQRSVRGLSLPISLFVLEDGESTKPNLRGQPNARGQRIWFNYTLTRAEVEAGKHKPKFQPASGGLRHRIGGFRFFFAQEWWDAFQVGTDVAKKLWASQNGRLRFADADAADRKLHASLNVDLRAACDTVEAVFKVLPDAAWERLDFDKRYITVGGRSAEAYWTQCVLSLLLPGGDVPLSVCTGTVNYKDGEFEMGNVAGIAAKLEYANRAGFPRVVVAGDSREYFEEEPLDEDEQGDESEDGSDTVLAEIAAETDSEDLDETDPVKAELKAFLDRLDQDLSKKTVEVNFARTARAAADAMQPSGWRRTDFLRTPLFQRKFSRTQKRLFMRDALRDRQNARRLKRVDIEDYRRSPWRNYEEGRLSRLDHLLSSRTGRTVVHIRRSDIERSYPGLTVEEALGKWAAWKDNQVRTGEGIGYKGPGLGVMTLRSAEADTETRLWAALAEMLDAAESWWDRFQWSDLPEAADQLAQLLCNQRADPDISLGSAPDILFVFDDAGYATRRTNTVFPAEFHHQFIDLLNPRHPSNHKYDYLDEALKRHDRSGRELGTRIVVVLAEDEQPETTQQDVDLDSEDRALLERLSIFRFGFSRHAAYALFNFNVEPAGRRGWKDFEQRVHRLIAARLVSVSRGELVITPKGRQVVGRPQLFEDPRRLAIAHRDAALALCPILYPQGARTSTNRDRQLEPGNVLEATWHLKAAYDLIPWRLRNFWQTNDGVPSVPVSQAQLTFLRTSPDWDTVERLRVNRVTWEDSIELCRELLEKQRSARGKQPPSPVVGKVLDTFGRYHKNTLFKKDEHPEPNTIDEAAEEIAQLVDDALTNLKDENLTKTEWQRRKRQLHSNELFALRMLGLPLADPRLVGARSYIDRAVKDILEPDFLKGLDEGREDLDDFPISRNCWRALWSDGKDESAPNKTLDPFERSRYAYAAARSNLSRTRPGSQPTDPWDEPWIVYFTMTQPDFVAPNQLYAPLMTWWEVYGRSFEESLAFGERILDKEMHAVRFWKKRKPVWEEKWLTDVSDSCENLWQYATHRDDAKRLVGAPVAPALRLIGSIGLRETLPAWRFVNMAGPGWLEHWSSLAQPRLKAKWPAPAAETFGFVADEWSALGRAVLGHKASWIVMLADLSNLSDDRSRLNRVMNWLRTYEALGCVDLVDVDPEELISKAREMPLVADFLSARHTAVSNARVLLALRNDRGHALYGHYRRLFNEQVRALDPRHRFM